MYVKNTFDCDSFSHTFIQHLVNVDMSPRLSGQIKMSRITAGVAR